MRNGVEPYGGLCNHLKLLGTITLAALLAVAHMVFRQRHVKSKATHAGNVILGGLFNKASQKKKDKLDDDMEGGGLGNGAQDEKTTCQEAGLR